ncbi:Hypothetical predicted protein, partial [Marmota monax]
LEVTTFPARRSGARREERSSLYLSPPRAEERRPRRHARVPPGQRYPAVLQNTEATAVWRRRQGDGAGHAGKSGRGFHPGG